MHRETDFAEIACLLDDDRAATEWARNHHLIADPVGNQCALTPGCTGLMYSVVVRGRPNIRCGKCKRYRSVCNAPAVFGGANAHSSWLTTTDHLDRPQMKLSVGVRIGILWLWANKVQHGQVRRFLGNRLGDANNATLSAWYAYIGNVLVQWATTEPQVGGLGEVIQVDESFMRGRRKNNVGRVMGGNAVPTARANYGNALVGPWVVGLVWKPNDGSPTRFRFAIVLRRNAGTMRRIITRYVAPGTMIWTDQWRAYRGIPTWGPPGNPYTHQTVNHSQNFVDPVTGANTQRIESNWREIKEAILSHTGGVMESLHRRLVEFAWRKEHSANPFSALLTEINRQFPQV
jgi:ISXO2-like transposase domain